MLLILLIKMEINNKKESEDNLGLEIIKYAFNFILYFYYYKLSKLYIYI